MTIFDSQSVATAVAATLAGAGITPAHQNAFLLVATTGGGIQAALSTRAGDSWDVALIGRAQKGQPIEGGIRLVRTW